MPVSGGLYNFLTLSPAAAAVQALLVSNKVDGVAQWPVYFSRADKQPPANYIVIHTVDAPPAAHSQDGPSGLSDGEFQFDSCAPDQLTAQALSNAVKAALENYSGVLSDGTTIQFYEVAMDADEPYEVGGGGYVFRRLLRLRAFYTEPGTTSYTPPITLVVAAGMTGGNAGIALQSAPLTFSTGLIASGNPVTNAVFNNLGGAFQAGTLSGNWDNPLDWSQVGTTSTYVLSGSVGGSPVVIVFLNVVFGGGFFHN